VIDFEFAHLNGMLVQLLGLYKLGVNQLPLQPAYHELDDFIEAQLASHQEVFASRGIIATFEVDPLSPLGFFDRELIASVLATASTTPFVMPAIAADHRQRRGRATGAEHQR
jgi:hypothetical protein